MTRKRQSKRSRARRIKLYTRMGVIVLIACMVILGGMKLLHIGPFQNSYMEITGADIDAAKPDVDVQLLTVNEYSRPGKRQSESMEL